MWFKYMLHLTMYQFAKCDVAFFIFFCYNQRCGNKTQNLDFQNKTYFGKHISHAGCIHCEVGAHGAGDIMEGGETLSIFNEV